MASPLDSLKAKLFFDGANIETMQKAYGEGLVKGFTTNSTLMRNAGITATSRSRYISGFPFIAKP